VAAGQRDSLAVLLEAINRAVAEAARTAGVPNEAIPSLAMRGAVLRVQLGNELTLPEPDQLALVLVGALSKGLDQLGFSPSSTNREGVIPATVLSHALATRLSAGSIDQPYQRLEWGGGVRADAASENTRLSWSLNPAASGSSSITAAVDVPVQELTADQTAPDGIAPLLVDLRPTGRTREIAVVSRNDLILTGLVNTSSAPQIQQVSYSSDGTLTLAVGAQPSRSLLSSSVPIRLSAGGSLSLQRGAALADTDVAVFQLPGLLASAGGQLLLGDGLQLQLTPNGSRSPVTGLTNQGSLGMGGLHASPSPVKGLTLNGASLAINGSITSSGPLNTSVNATDGDLTLEAGRLSLLNGLDISGLKGDQRYAARGRILQAMALGSTGGNSDSDSAPSISLQAGTGLISSAAITAASLQMATTSGVLRTDPQLYTNAAGDLVDLLGYRVDNQGGFVDGGGQPLPQDQAPIYAGPPTAAVIVGAIQAPDLSMDAGSGTLLLQNSITPAGVSSTTLMASAFRAADHGFALEGAVPAHGTAVRFYGVQPGALSNLEDGGIYWVVRSASAPGLLQLARSASDAASGQVIALSLAANLVGAAAVGQLLQAPLPQGSQAALRGGSIGMTQSATLQASNLT